LLFSISGDMFLAACSNRPALAYLRQEIRKLNLPELVDVLDLEVKRALCGASLLNG